MQVQALGAQAAGQLLADRLHAVGGEPDRAPDEGAPQQVEVAAGGGQLVLQQDAGQEGAEEALEGGVAHARAARSASSAVRSGAASSRRTGAYPARSGEGGERGLVPQRAERRA